MFGHESRFQKSASHDYGGLQKSSRGELIDDVIYTSPSPVKNHQKTLQTIFRRTFVGPDRIFHRRECTEGMHAERNR
jgi:hypothetical protein